jgi:3-phosphoshikimate 1-carboxyvinyltransferase
MKIDLKKSVTNKQSTIAVTGSKSETNRLLLLKALYPNLKLQNISNSDDSDMMHNALSNSSRLKDIHHAGTAMRFLTAYFSIQEDQEVVLTGSSRMQERPIKILVEALKQLDVVISYEKNEGYPPIKIRGKRITKNEVILKADVSSQYISALLLIAPKLENGLKLILEGKITSVPYINMTLALLNEIGVITTFENNIISVTLKNEVKDVELIVESDWSSASYFYSIVALSEIGTQISLTSYKKNSLQGDSSLVEIYADFGVETTFVDNSIVITKIEKSDKQFVEFDLQSSPDIAQTIVVTCFGLGLGCCLKGLHTLKIKETDRLEALKVELTKLGAIINVTNDSLTLDSSLPNFIIKSNISIATYQDHRMAMAFAPLALRTPIAIEDAEVVSKSFPDFWNDLKNIGFQFEETL